MRYLDVPYFQQDRGYTCGPTALQMVLRYYGIVESELTLAKELLTAANTGTTHGHMIATVKKHGLHCYINDDSSLNEVGYFLSTFSVPSIVRYLEPEENEDHYAVVVGLSEDTIALHDPWHGERVRFSLRDFEDRWKCDLLGTCNHWLMAVSKDPIPLGRQYHPAH